MMGRALLMVGWISTGGLVLTGILGHRVGEQGSLGWHLLAALFSTLLLLFSHSWILFYLIGTGKAIKTAAQEYDLGGNLAAQTRAFKNRSNSWLMLAMMAVMATFIVGGGVATRVLPVWVHSSLFWTTLAIQVWTLVIEGKVLGDNERLMRQVDRQVKSVESDAQAS
ncbi:MAG: hypothetical protein WBP10_08145 [Thermoanaerobaculia bacterium]|jgi:hypothetical protein